MECLDTSPISAQFPPISVYNFAGTDEYYRLDEDPYELENVIAEEKHRDRIREMRNVLKDYFVANDHPMCEGFLRTSFHKCGRYPITL